MASTQNPILLDAPGAALPQSLPQPVAEGKPTFTDRARITIAYWLLAILTGIIVLSFALLLWALESGNGSTQSNFEHIAALLNILFGPVATLVGSAVGFYFGAQAAQASANDSR